jgi:hypothetical protein
MKARFQSIIASPWIEMNPVQLGNVPETVRSADYFVVVEDGNEPRMRIDIYGDSYSAFRAVVFWKKFIVLGWDHDVHFINIENGNAKTVYLESYFGHLYPTESFLLAASGEKLFCFAGDANLLWISDALGIDGVVVNHIDDNFIHGDGEWDPPGGWKPFRLKANSGEFV